jgi:hypothetical protein
MVDKLAMSAEQLLGDEGRLLNAATSVRRRVMFLGRRITIALHPFSSNVIGRNLRSVVTTSALTFIKDELPNELQRLFLSNKEAELAWIRLGQSRQRQLLESPFAAKKQETRDRRVAHIKTMLTDLRTAKP